MSHLTYEEVEKFMIKFFKENGRYPRKYEVSEGLDRKPSSTAQHVQKAWAKLGIEVEPEANLTREQFDFWELINHEWSGNYKELMALSGKNKSFIVNAHAAYVQWGLLPPTNSTQLARPKERAPYQPPVRVLKDSDKPTYIKITGGTHKGEGGLLLKDLLNGKVLVYVYSPLYGCQVSIKVDDKDIEYVKSFAEKKQELLSSGAIKRKKGIPKHGMQYRGY